jgi:vancomycin resistance protein VanJ
VLNALIVIGALVLALLLGAHAIVPDIAGLGLLLDSALPWFGLGIPVLIVLALFARGGKPWIAILVPVAVWGVMFVPAILPLSWSAPAAAEKTLTIASQNVEAGSGTATESATTLAATGADAIAFQEMDGDSKAAIAAVLDPDYQYSYGVGTVGLWSKYPILNAQPWDLGLGWQRALAADLQTPTGLVSIYVIHAASARPGDHGERDTMLTNLSTVLPNDQNDRIVAVGDFNASSTDRSMSGIFSELTEPNQTGGGFGFTWPASFPITRPDHVLQSGLAVVSSTTLKAGNSDHLATLTTMNL